MSDQPTHYGSPVSDEQRRLLARLIGQKRVTIEQLREAGVQHMTRAALARWLDEAVLGNSADERTLSEVEALFGDAPAGAPRPGGRTT